MSRMALPPSWLGLGLGLGLGLDVAHGAAALLQPAEDDARSAEEQPRLLAHLGLETDRVAHLG